MNTNTGEIRQMDEALKRSVDEETRRRHVEAQKALERNLEPSSAAEAAEALDGLEAAVEAELTTPAEPWVEITEKEKAALEDVEPERRADLLEEMRSRREFVARGREELKEKARAGQPANRSMRRHDRRGKWFPETSQPPKATRNRVVRIKQARYLVEPSEGQIRFFVGTRTEEDPKKFEWTADGAWRVEGNDELDLEEIRAGKKAANAHLEVRYAPCRIEMKEWDEERDGPAPPMEATEDEGDEVDEVAEEGDQ